MKAVSRVLILLIVSLFSLNSSAKIYDSFMCYTQVNTVVIFGVLKELPYVDIHYQRLEKRSVRIPLKVKDYDREKGFINIQAKYKGSNVIEMKSTKGSGLANIDLTKFKGTEDTEFTNEDVLCYFGQIDDK